VGADEPRAFGDLLRRYRIGAGLTQEALAERAGLSSRGIADLERGVRRFPYPSTLRLLAESLGLTPDQAQALAEAGRKPAGSQDASTEDVSASLPVPLTSFIGREREVAEIGNLVHARRLVTLTGPGGVGKTRLALQVAHAGMGDGVGEVRFVELSALADAGLLPHKIVASLGLREQSGRPVLATLVDYFGHRRALLVLDTCEHLVDACAELAEALLRGCPSLHVLATSREVLGLPVETAWRVPSLSLPHVGSPTDPSAASRSEAVRMFVERVGQSLPGFEVTQRNAEAIARVCRRLDGIPLAIELAAARVNVLGLDGITAHLDDALHLLRGGKRTAPTRQQTLAATIEWSYRLLSEAERLLFRRLAVFGGGWTLEAAERVCTGGDILADDVLDLLGRLIDKSLVLAETGSDGLSVRYFELDTLRQYGTERLREDGSEDQMRAQHARFFLELAEQAEPALWGQQLGAWQQRLEREHDNLRAAMRWLVDHGAIEEAQRLGGALARFWLLGGFFHEGRLWLAELLAASPAAKQKPQLRSKLLNGAGMLASFQGDHAAARAALDESVGLWEANDTSLELAHALHRLAELAWWHAEYARAHALAERAVSVSRAVGDQRIQSMSLYVLGSSALDVGEFAAARAAGQESLATARQAGFPVGAAMAELLLGRVGHLQGDLVQGREHLVASTALFRAANFPWGIAHGLAHLGWVALDEGNVTQARTLFEESLTLGQRVGAATRVLVSLEGCAQLAALDGQPDRALRLFGAAAAQREAGGAGLGLPDQALLTQRIATARASVDPATADAAFEAGRTISLEEAMNEALVICAQRPAPEVELADQQRAT
jgi:predicted ATPase/DNA-binding XRE family transcriptional regulator